MVRLSSEALALLKKQNQAEQKPADRPKRLPVHITITDDKDGRPTVEENTLLGTAARRRHDLNQMLEGTHPDQKTTGGNSSDWAKTQLKGELGGSIQTGGRGTGHTEDSTRPIENVVIRHQANKPKKPKDGFNNPGFLGE
jgi:hypothetical protein